MSVFPLPAEVLRVGYPTPFALRDKSGNLLVARGVMGLGRPAPAPPTAHPCCATRASPMNAGLARCATITPARPGHWPRWASSNSRRADRTRRHLCHAPEPAQRAPGDVGNGRLVNAPAVLSVSNAGGTPLGVPAPRDTRSKPHDVTGGVAPHEVNLRLNLVALVGSL